MKKTIAIILTIITMLALCSCGSKEKEYELTSPAEEQSGYTLPENADQQKQLIDQMKSTWELPAEYSPWYYTITDLDRNGRFEVITAATQGTGIFTYADFWEVTEGFDGLNHCTGGAQEGDAWPEIIVDSAPCYEDGGKYYYVFQDDAKGGPAEYYTAKEAICLDSGSVARTFIASKYVEYLDGGAKMNVECKDAGGNVISESEYEFAVEKFFSGKTPETVQFSWTEVNEEPIREPELVFASDLFDGYGFVHKQCDTTGVYDFYAIESEGIVWEVYILDKEFTDAERFIPQAYPCALKGDGSVSIEEGEWIYVYCPCNQWTMQEAPEGCAYSWGLNPNKEYTERAEETPAAVAGPGVVITKSPTSETLTVGGKTWFIAYADNADKAEWQFINPTDGRAYSPEQAAAMNKGLETEVLEQNTLAVSNVPLSLNGWQVQAVFSGSGKSAATDAAAIYVGDYLSAYSSVLNAYKTGSGDIIYTPVDEALKQGCYGNVDGIGVMATMVSGTGYYFKDINKDGTPELFIGATGSNENEDFIIDSFTLKNGAPCRIAASSERCLYRLRRDNLISLHGSSGAADTMELLLRFSPEGLSVESGAAIYGEPGAGDFNYYKIKDASLTRPNADVLSEQDYNALVADIHSKDLKFSVTKIK